jgi:Fis family transcriptional regulator
VKRDLDSLVLQMHDAGISYADAVREFKKRFIMEVLARHRGNQCKAAAELKMHRNTLSRTLAELDMSPEQIKKGLRRPVRSVRPGDRSVAANPAARSALRVVNGIR